jgi:hypothetical protein
LAALADSRAHREAADSNSVSVAWASKVQPEAAQRPRAWGHREPTKLRVADHYESADFLGWELAASAQRSDEPQERADARAAWRRPKVALEKL